MPGKLKIVLHCNSLGVGKGGAERVATDLAVEMVRRGHIVYMGYKNNGPPAYSQGDGVKLLPYDSIDSFSKNVIEVDPDVLFSFYVNHLLINYYSMICRTNIPFGIQECTNPSRVCQNNWKRGKAGHSYSAWEREMIASGAVRIRVTMPGYKLSFPDYIRPQVYAFSNPAQHQTNLCNPSGYRKESKTIININGFKENKNLISLVQAFARLAHISPEWKLKIVGKPPNEEFEHVQQILQVIRQNNLQDRVEIIKPQEDLYPHYVTAHIHVISSLAEGCPTVVLEAMSVGLPSIGYADCPGTNELIRHESNGFLADPHDRIVGLETALRKLMASSETRLRFGYQAREDAKSFEPEKIYDQWETLFYEAAEYKKDPGRLFREQMAIDSEKAMHARRMREKIIQNTKGKI
jgi:glycosyltransferase involved in cell wall biosynthesis